MRQIFSKWPDLRTGSRNGRENPGSKVPMRLCVSEGGVWHNRTAVLSNSPRRMLSERSIAAANRRGRPLTTISANGVCQPGEADASPSQKNIEARD